MYRVTVHCSKITEHVLNNGSFHKTEREGNIYAKLLVWLCDLVALLVLMSMREYANLFEYRKKHGFLKSCSIKGCMIENTLDFNPALKLPSSFTQILNMYRLN